MEKLRAVNDSYFILDLSSMMWRAWHVGKRQENVSPSFVFCRMLLALMKTHHPRCIVAAEDCASSRFARQRIYPDYKNKPRDPEEMKLFHAFAAEIKRILDVMMIRRLSFPGYEADDVVASILNALIRPQQLATATFVIVTSDKDLYQLIDGRTLLYDLSSKQLLGASGARAKKGFSPHQTTGVLALSGDASDNIPGVPGVGIKTAVKLLEKYGTVSGVLHFANELTPKLAVRLTACTDQVLMAFELVQLRNDLIPSLVVLPLETDDFWKARVSELFKELGFGREIIGDLHVSL